MPRGLTPHRGRDLARLGAAGAACLVLASAMAVARIEAQGGRDEQRPVDAIVVLGAAQYDGRPSPVYAARLEHAVGLWYAGLAPRLVLTGGGAPGDRTTEAAVGRAYALERQVPDEAILWEDRGRTTLESMRAVAGVLDAAGARTVLFVSDPTHLLRVLRIARDLGLEAYGSPTPTSPVARDPARHARAVAHEVAALAVYFLAGLTPPVDDPVAGG